MSRFYRESLLLLLFVFCGGLLFSQTNKNAASSDELSSQKSAVNEFNNKRKHLSGGQEQTVYFYKKMEDNDISLVLDYLDKLDDKIIRVGNTIDKSGLKIYYSIDAEMIDIMQGLKKINYPVYYITSDGSHASIDAHGGIEIVQMNK